MKKAVLAVTALFATVTAAPAMAAEFSYGGFMRYRGIYIDPGTATAVWGGSPQETNERWEYRVRQFFNLKVNDHVTTNVKLEWNPQWGDEQQIGAGPGDLQLGGGADEVQLRIKNAFVAFDLPGTPIRLTVGQQDFSTPKAIVSVEDGTGIKAQAKLAPLDLTLWWQRNVRGANNATGVDDANWFGVVPSFKTGDITIAPHLSLFKTGAGVGGTYQSGASRADTEVIFVGVDSTGKFGALGFTFDFIYQTGETGVGGAIDISSFVLDASVSLAAGPGTLTIKGIYSPGDDNPADTDVESWTNIVATDLGWSPFFHDGSSISGFAGTINPAPGSGAGGIMALGVEYALSPYKDFTLTPNAYYLMAAEDVNLAGGAADDLYGIELGVQANWRIWDAMSIIAQLDYLLVGDVFETAAGESDDAWRFFVGPTISW